MLKRGTPRYPFYLILLLSLLSACGGGGGGGNDTGNQTANDARNTAPVASNDTNSVTEDSATPTVSGNVLSNDNDADGDTLTVSNAATLNNSGNYGNLSIAADGSYSYTLDNTNSSVNALNNGETLSETFSYTVSDGSLSDTGSLVITINGVTDAVGAVDLSGVWLFTTSVTSETPAGCAGGSGSTSVSAISISQAGNVLTVQTLDGATLTGIIDTSSGAFSSVSGSVSGVEYDLSQPTTATAQINWQDNYTVSGSGVTASTISGTINTTETSSGNTDCSYSESFSASFSYGPSGTENYSGVYAFETLENRVQADSSGLNSYIKIKPMTLEMEFTANDVIPHMPEQNLSSGSSILFSNSRFDPATGVFSITATEKYKADTDGDPSTIEGSETSSGIMHGIFLHDPGVNSGSTGDPLLLISMRTIHRDYIGDVDAGGTLVRSGNRESIGYSKRLSTVGKTRTRLVEKSDSSTETQILMGLNNPPLKTVDANSRLYMEVLDGTTLLCSVPFQSNGSVRGAYRSFEKLPFSQADFYNARFRGNTYSNLRCNTNDPSTGQLRVIDGNSYTLRVLDTGANGINDGGTGDDVIAYSTSLTASVVAPAERYSQVTDVASISVNGISPASGQSGDAVPLPGFYSNGLLSSLAISWPAHPEGADRYELRIDPVDSVSNALRYYSTGNSRTIDISSFGSSVYGLSLVAQTDVSSNGARAQASSRQLLIVKGITGTFALDLGNSIDAAYKNMQIAFQTNASSISSCTVSNNTNLSCNAAASSIDFSANVVSLNMTDITGTLVGAGNNFTLELRFSDTATAWVTSPDSIGLPAVQDGTTSAVLVP